MADALCGPSNALQSFQKHTSVDRTLQQDRLVGRQSPSQGFRSSSGLPGALDAEFEAFQAGQDLPLQPSQGFHHRLPPPQFAQSHLSQAPDWASDFQRLNLSSPNISPPVQQQQHVPTSSASSAWHQDFMQQQQQRHDGLAGMSYSTGGFTQPSLQHGMGFTGLPGSFSTNMNIAQQEVREQVPQFDEAAFEQAFAQAQQDMVVEDMTSTAPSTLHSDVVKDETEGPALQRLREQRPGVYAALKIRSAIDTGNFADIQRYFDFIDSLEESSALIRDASEGQWIADTLRKVATQGEFQEHRMRAEHLIKAVNERLMSTYPLHSSTVPHDSHGLWRELEAAGYTRSSAPEQPMEQANYLEQESQEMRPPPDEMAETAGQLLERVADNTSSKFQNSQFLQLMRRLRDREVRVEGDKMVEVSDISTSSSSSAPLSQDTLPPQSASSSATVTSTTVPPASTSIPPIDPNILDHAATDFAMPVSIDNLEYASTANQINGETDTDETTGQFNYYNANGAYHK